MTSRSTDLPNDPQVLLHRLSRAEHELQRASEILSELSEWKQMIDRRNVLGDELIEQFKVIRKIVIGNGGDDTPGLVRLMDKIDYRFSEMDRNFSRLIRVLLLIGTPIMLGILTFIGGLLTGQIHVSVP